MKPCYDDDFDAMDDALHKLDPNPCKPGYYKEMRSLNHSILRRLWIAEGKRRGYELVDA